MTEEDTEPRKNWRLTIRCGDPGGKSRKKNNKKKTFQIASYDNKGTPIFLNCVPLTPFINSMVA